MRKASLRCVSVYDWPDTARFWKLCRNPRRRISPMLNGFWDDGVEIFQWGSSCRSAGTRNCAWWFLYGAATPPDLKTTICKSSSSNISPWSSASGRSGRIDGGRDPTECWTLRRTRGTDIPSTCGCACAPGTRPDPRTSCCSCSARTCTLSTLGARRLGDLSELCTNQTSLCRTGNGTCDRYFRLEVPKSCFRRK